MTQNQIQQWLSDAAYFISIQREPAPGKEMTDWLIAEQQLQKKLKKPVKPGLVRIV